VDSAFGAHLYRIRNRTAQTANAPDIEYLQLPPSEIRMPVMPQPVRQVHRASLRPSILLRPLGPV
jgi:hypothetical protein